jgi:hypothetical protein
VRAKSVMQRSSGETAAKRSSGEGVQVDGFLLFNGGAGGRNPERMRRAVIVSERLWCRC